jgi:hypothetical protein
MNAALFLCVFVVTVSAASFGQSAPDPLQAEVVAKEREGLDCLKTGNLKRFGELTADDAVFVDDHGPASKATVLKSVANFTLTDYTMEDIHFVRLTPHSGLIAYKINQQGTSHGHEFRASAYVSSVWTRKGRDWQCQFSQESSVAK